MMKKKVTAMRITAISFGLLCGITGLIAGIFECLQGPMVSNDFIISSIGPTHAMWQDHTYKAFSIFSKFTTTGSIAILTSAFVCIWSIAFLHKKYGSWGFLVLSVFQLLAGGAFVIDLAIITFLVSLRIDRPPEWWRRKLPSGIQRFLVPAWPWSLAVFIVISFSLLLITILGIDNGPLLQKTVPLATAMFLPIILMVFGGFAVDLSNSQGPVLK